MAETPRLDLPYLAASQAQKEVYHNISLDRLDLLVQCSVLDRNLSTPPASPALGEAYIVGPSPTGAWSGHASELALWVNSQWQLIPPLAGFQCWIVDEALAVYWNGTAWVATGGGSGASSFLALSDTPNDYTGQAGKAVVVNPGATALEFALAGAGTFLALTDTPDLYTGAGGQFVKVNAGATALEFGAGTTGTFLNLSDTPDTYTGQQGKIVSVKSDATGVEFIPQASGTLGLHRGALLALSADQAIADATATILAWSSATYDTSSVWSASQPTRLVVPADVSRFMVMAQVELDGSSAGFRRLRLLKNGTTVAGQGTVQQPVQTSSLTPAHVVLSVQTPPLAVMAGDYFEVEILHDSGAALNAVAGQQTWAAAMIISEMGAGGVSTFLELGDTPDAYTGQAGKAVLVNAGATALEFGTAGAGTFLALTDTPDIYSGQAGKVVAVNAGATALEFIEAGGGGGGGESITNDGVTVKRTATQGITSGVLEVVSFDTETLDQGTYWSSGQPTRVTVPQAGWYTISIDIDWSGSAAGFRDINARVNGTTYILFDRIPTTASNNILHLLTGTAYLSASDYIEAVLFQNSVSTLTITCTMSVMRAGGGPGSTTFLSLTDTPDVYTANALKILRVNAAANATEFGPVLGTMAEQNANAVAITGGAISLGGHAPTGVLDVQSSVLASDVANSYYGVRVWPVYPAGATSGNAIRIEPATGAGVNATGFRGLVVTDQPAGLLQAYALNLQMNAGTERYNIYAVGSAANFFGGTVQVVGTVGINTAPLSNTHLLIDVNKNTHQAITLRHVVTDTGVYPVIQFLNGASGNVGTITTTASATSYNTTSDVRLKHSIQPLTGALARINALKPITHRWHMDDSPGEGFLAHELQQHVPLAVTGQPDEVNEDGSIKPQQVDHSKLIVHLVGAVQELLAQVQTLTTRIHTLEEALGG